VTGFSRTAAILSAIALGALVPQAHVLAGAIRWLVIAMLFLVFLQTRVAHTALQGRHFALLAANVGMGLAGWGVGTFLGGREIGLAAFFCGITPTAIAAPVIISFLRGRVEFVVAAFLLTNLSIAAILPLLLPVVLGRATPEAFTQVAGTIAVIVFIPMLLAWIMRRIHPPAVQWPARVRNVSFGMWIGAMFLITANASRFLRDHAEMPHVLLAQLAGVSLLICVANFTLGRWIGGKDFAREASQALGQKNTAFTIYLAMAYASPVVALGPTCYVIWHNLWNSWQLHIASRKPARGTNAPEASQ
jgi:BASS family bile acid:Na+ symporter